MNGFCENVRSHSDKIGHDGLGLCQQESNILTLLPMFLVFQIHLHLVSNHYFIQS